ncbi:MAG: VOC family protein [Myxococcaceae bacterium]|nr:VOC family protein [Myxococcaceae bacterium]
MRLSGFHHAAVFARDVAKVADFYQQVIGLPLIARHHHPGGALRSVWLGVSTLGGVEQGFLAVEEASGRPAAGSAVIALRIAASDRAGIVRALADAQVPIEKESRWTVYVRDPEGNVLGLSHHPHDLPGT